MRVALPIAIIALLLVASSPGRPKAEVRHGPQHHHHASSSAIETPQNQPSSVATPAETHTYTYNYYYPDKSTVPPVPFQIVTTVLLLLFTGGLWVTSIWQWRAARKTLLLQFRPKLTVRNVAVKPIYMGDGIAEPTYYFVRNQIVVGQLYVANVGDSPATIIESLCKMYWMKGALPMSRPYEGENGNNPILGRIEAGERKTLVFASDKPLDISHTDIAPIGKGDMRSANQFWSVYVMGWIEYRDEIGFERRSAFCRVFDISTSRFVPINDPDYEHVE